MSSSEIPNVFILDRLAFMRFMTASIPSWMGILPYKLHTSMLNIMLLGGKPFGKAAFMRAR